MNSEPVDCPSCKHTNPASSHFCNICGTPLLDDGLGDPELGLKVIEAAMAKGMPATELRRPPVPGQEAVPAQPKAVPAEVRLADLPVLWPPLTAATSDNATAQPQRNVATVPPFDMSEVTARGRRWRAAAIVAAGVLGAVVASGYYTWSSRQVPPPAAAPAERAGVAGPAAVTPVPSESITTAVKPEPAGAAPNTAPPVAAPATACSDAVAALGLCPASITR